MIESRGSIVGVFLLPEWPPSVRPAAQTSFRDAEAVPESCRIDEFRNARRRRQSRSPQQAGSPPSEPFLNGR